MKKTLIALSIAFTSSFAQLVDGVSVTVNNLPITLFDVVKTAQMQKISNEQAVDLLINSKLQEWALERKKITVSDYEVTKQIEKIAQNNNMSVSQLKDALRARYISYDSYKADVKKDLERKKLYEQIAQESFSPFDDKSLQIYFDTHKQEFAEPLKLDVTQYASKNQQSLEALQASPLTSNNQDIQKQDVVVNTSTLDQSIVNMFKMAKAGSFTPIMPIKNEYVTFYVKDVIEWKYPTFAEARNQVFEAMALQQQDEAIKEYFEKIKSSAQIKIIRLP